MLFGSCSIQVSYFPTLLDFRYHVEATALLRKRLD